MAIRISAFAFPSSLSARPPPLPNPGGSGPREVSVYTHTPNTVVLPPLRVRKRVALNSSLRLNLQSGLDLMMGHVYRVIEFTLKIVKELEESTGHLQGSEDNKK